MSPNQKQQVYSCRKTSRSDNLFKILLSYQLCNKNISFLTKCKVKVIPVHFSTRVFRIFNKQLIYIVYQDNIVNIDGVIVTCPSTTVRVFPLQNRKLYFAFFPIIFSSDVIKIPFVEKHYSDSTSLCHKLQKRP